MICAPSLTVVACGGISTSSPAADVKRTLNESPYTTAVAMALRRVALASRATHFFQVMICLCPLLVKGITMI
jgi:hypothetical protein